MGIRMRPIGEMGLPSGELQEVTCWQCHERMEVPRTVRRATCPGCGSRVAIHRLRMPMMPNRTEVGGRKAAREEEVIRLGERAGKSGEEGETIPARRGKRELEPMPRLENGKPAPILTETDAAVRPRRREEKFEPRHKVEEVRERLFVEAAPRLQGIDDGPRVPRRVARLVVASVALCAGLIALGVVLALRVG